MNFVIFLGICCSIIICVKSDANERPMVDHATLDYLSIENDLWIKLQNSFNDDKEYLFSLVSNDHKRFLGNATFVGGTDQNVYHKQSTENLANILQRIESLRLHIVDILETQNVQFKDIIHVFEHKVLNNALIYSREIFREISRHDFWEDEKRSTCIDQGSQLVIESSYQRIFDYYRDVRAGLLQTYIYTQLSLMLKNIKNKTNGTRISQTTLSLRAKDELKERIKLMRQIAQNTLKDASRDIWACHVNRDNHASVTNFLQGFFDNELNFNTDDTCTKSCSDYTQTRNVACMKKTLCAQSPENHKTICGGEIRDCINPDIHDEFNICYSDRSDRRYEKIDFDGDQSYGLDSSSCSATLQAKTWRRFLVKCTTCYCLCDDPEISERKFSLHEVLSDIEQNKVVTGIRIIKEDSVFQFHISERTLKPRAQVDASEKPNWKGSGNNFNEDAVEGKDFFELSYENRSINLDDIDLPAGKLVTGVCFFNINGHILLHVRATDFDYATGQLDPASSVWLMNDGGKEEIASSSRIDPLKQYDQDFVYTPENASGFFVRFGPTDLENDLGQTTIPIIETQPLEPTNLAALSGVGLTYRNHGGGIIAPKLIAYQTQLGDSIFD